MGAERLLIGRRGKAQDRLARQSMLARAVRSAALLRSGKSWRYKWDVDLEFRFVVIFMPIVANS